MRAGTIVRVAAAGVAAARPAAVRTARGWEPLIAYYPSSASNHVEAALSHGRRAPHTMLDRAGAVAVRVSDRSELVNVNTPADLAVAAQR